MTKLAVDLLGTAERLGARLKKSGAREWVGPCPQCGEIDRFSINQTKGLFYCRGCGVGGDAITLARHLNNCGFREALGFLNLDTRQPPKRRAAYPKRAESVPRVTRAIADIIREMRPIRGTRGERYFRETRRIDTDAIADVLERTDAIGWHPAVFFSEPGHAMHGRCLGCIVGVMTDPVTARPTGAISRTYIDENLRKIGKAKTLGAPAGVVRLSRDEDVLQGLHLAEGLETALSAMAKGLRPVWSTGSTALMKTFPVLNGIDCLTVIADHDDSAAGEETAREVEARWRRAGRYARIFMPASPGDLNDLLQRAKG